MTTIKSQSVIRTNRDLLRAFIRDPQQSIKIAPAQWTFVQWARQSKNIKDVVKAAQANNPKHKKHHKHWF